MLPSTNNADGTEKLPLILSKVQPQSAPSLSVSVEPPGSTYASPTRRAGSARKRASPQKATPETVQLPSYTAVYKESPQAAGVPIVELVRKLEEERILSRNDRMMVNEALKSPSKKDALTKALRDVELGSNKHFAAKRLKAIIYQAASSNQKTSSGAVGEGGVKKVQPPSGGAPSSSAPSPSARSIMSKKGAPADDTQSLATVNPALDKTREMVSTVVGENPKYAGAAASPNVCLKIARRLRDFLVKYNPNTMGVRKFAVIVGTGSYNPLTRMHLRAFFLGKQHLESKSDYVVLGSLLSPAHPSLVRQRYRACPNENMPPLHRLAIAQMCVESSKWMTVDPWEITRRRAMDYSSMLEHTTRMLQHNFPSIDVRVFYLCKSNAIPLISPSVLREGNYGCICVTRPQESDQLRKSLGSRWNGLIYIADDTAILDAGMDKISAKNVRDRLKAGKSIVPLVGTRMAEYFDDHRIREKMLGEEEWEDEEKQLPTIKSRNIAPLSPTKEGGPSESDGDSSIGNPSSPMRAADVPAPMSPWKAAQLSPRGEKMPVLPEASAAPSVG